MTPADGSPSGSPETISRYKIVERLTGSDTGEVYKAFDPVLQRPLAIKLLRIAFNERTSVQADTIKERFYREIQRVAALVHPGIARLFDGGELPTGFFLASEFVDGVSLASAMASSRPVDVNARLFLLRQIAEALDYAHQNDTPHLNLTSNNVLVSADNSVKVAGFGIARVREAMTSRSDAGEAPEWTTAFTAPEVTLGRAADTRADVYSFGAVAVELFGGAPVGARNARPAKWTDEGSAPVLPAAAGVPGEQAAAAALARALSPVPDQRFATAGACLEALTGAFGLSGLAPSRLWETVVPAAAAGMSVDQLKQIDNAATEAGIPAYLKQPEVDLDETFAGPLPPPGEPFKAPPRPATSRPAPGPAPPGPNVAETVYIPRGQSAAGGTAAPPATPPSAPTPPSTPAKPPAPVPQPPAGVADLNAGETVLAPRKRADVPEPPDAGKTVLIPRKADVPAAPDPSEVKTTYMPRGPNVPKFDPAAASAPPGPADPAQTMKLSASDARGASPSEPADKTVLMPASRRPAVPPPAAAAVPTDATVLRPAPPRAVQPPASPPASSARPAVVPAPSGARPAVPPPAVSPAPAPIAFPPPAAAAPRQAPAPQPSAPPNKSGAGLVLGLLALIVVVAATGAAFLFVPSLRQLWSRGPDAQTSTSAPEPPPTSVVSVTTSQPLPPATTTEPLPGTATSVPEPGTTTTSAAPATAGTLNIRSTPPGAAVSVDGRPRGVTPLRVTGLTLGEHAIELTSDGYNPAQQRVSLSAQRTSRNVEVTLAKAVVAPTTGAVSVLTDPAGARISIDGSAAGNAPLTVANLAPGKHAIQAEREGFESAARDVDVKAGETATVNISLRAAQVRPSPPPQPTGPVPIENVEVKPQLRRGSDSPPYPRAAAQARVEGYVDISFVVDETGAVSDINIIQSSSSLFNSDVTAWARGLRFEPGRQGGKPVKVRIVRRFRFERRQ